MASLFSHPLSLTYNVGVNLIWNGVDIIYEVGQASEAWKHGHFVDFGTNVGKMIAKGLLSGEQATQGVQDEASALTEDISEVIEGLFIGAVQEQGTGKYAEECITDK